jgi:hypothetical protein
MPAHAIETRRLLQLREDIADERENHEVSV